jgi:hypothetical protein
MFKIICTTAIVLGSLALAATAATPAQCLKANELEAEQAIRYQAELMVVSDTCGAQTYTAFARRNREVLVDYQHQVIERFRRSGVAHPENRFDSYLTRLANEVSLRTGAQPVAAICTENAELLATADTLDHDKFRRYIADRASKPSGEIRRCK